MIRFFFVIFSFLLVIHSNAQEYNPSILVLYPNEVSADDALIEEIKEINNFLETHQEANVQSLQSYITTLDNEPENIRLSYEKKLDFLEEADFYSTISMVAENFLQFKLYDRFNSLLVYASNVKSSGELINLRLHAIQNNMRYILNFPKVHSFLDGDKKYTEITVQLYDNEKDSVVYFNQTLGSDLNPGFEFACEEGTLECTVNNALGEALMPILEIIFKNNAEIIAEQNLLDSRRSYLMQLYDSIPAERDILEIIADTKPSLDTDGFYHGFYNSTRDKFVSFYLQKNDARNFADLKDRDTKNVQIYSTGTDGTLPELKAFVIAGVKLDDRWFVQKDEVIFFSEKSFELGQRSFFTNLAHWNYFVENTTSPNPQFWESHFFEKVKDVSKEKDYKEFYESIYKNLERKNKPYIGQYKIAADQLKEEESIRHKRFKERMKNELLIPFFEKKMNEGSLEFFDIALHNNDFVMIIPSDHSAFITPLGVQDANGKVTLRYFVSLGEFNELYEWTIAQNIVLESTRTHYGTQIVDQMKVLTDWNFGFETLDNKRFWKQYVFKKSKGEFRYLRKVN